MFFGMKYLFYCCKNIMKSLFIWCFCQWVGEKAEREDSGSGDYDCDCVVEWQRGVA